MDKSEIYEKQLSKIFQRLLVDKYPVISNIEFEIEYRNLDPDGVGENEYDISMVIYYSRLLSDVPRHKRLEKIKDYFGISYYESIHEFITKIIKYVIPERISLSLFNDIDLLP